MGSTKFLAFDEGRARTHDRRGDLRAEEAAIASYSSYPFNRLDDLAVPVSFPSVCDQPGKIP